MDAPTVSVVLPVYNCSRYVGEAIKSVLTQTFTDFELIVIDDGSTDDTPSILARFSDVPRVKLFTQANGGLARTLNRGIELARGRYIARQDHDDICRPQRLAAQVMHFDAHPACALVGTWAEVWREGEPTGRTHRHPAANGALKYELLLNNPFVHSSVMIRKAALDDVGKYSTDPARQPPEDFELWSRIARKYEVANIPEVLHVYRELDSSMSRQGSSPFVRHLVRISAENIAWAANVEPDNQHALNIARIAHGVFEDIQGTPDADAMAQVFQRAAESVVAPEDSRKFARDARRKIQAMRLTHPEVFGLHPLRSRLERVARRSASFLIDRFS